MLPNRVKVYLLLTVFGIAVVLLETGINLNSNTIPTSSSYTSSSAVTGSKLLFDDQHVAESAEQILIESLEAKQPSKVKQLPGDRSTSIKSLFPAGYKPSKSVLDLLANSSILSVEVVTETIPPQIFNFQNSRGQLKKPSSGLLLKQHDDGPPQKSGSNAASGPVVDQSADRSAHINSYSTGPEDTSSRIGSSGEHQEWNVTALVQNITRLSINGSHDARVQLNQLLNAALNPLRAFPVVSLEGVNRILLLTYFRSGSTFMGELLQRNWKSFYDFEPLHYMTNGMRIVDERVPEAAELIKRLYNCEFSKIKPYLWWAAKRRNRFLFRWNSFLWSLCRFRSNSCFQTNFVTDTCQRAPVHVMKVARLHLRHLEHILPVLDHVTQENPLKVVHLVRDPRGIYSSRKKLTWCTTTECGSVENLCQEMRDDLAWYRALKSKFAKSGKLVITQVRYEDMALNPESETEKLFSAVGLKFGKNVKQYLASHTNPKKVVKAANGTELANRSLTNPYSTKRESKSAAFNWRIRLDWDEVDSIQSLCSDVLIELGYKIFKDRSQYEVSTITEMESADRFMQPINPFSP